MSYQEVLFYTIEACLETLYTAVRVKVGLEKTERIRRDALLEDEGNSR